MPITINGSTGIAGVDGSASTPAIQGTDTNTGVTFPAADTVAVSTGGTERMRVDSSGNVGIGTASPASPLDVSGTIRGTNFAAPDGQFVFWGNGAVAIKGETNTLQLFTNSLERARITSGGDLCIGTTASGGYKLRVDGATGAYVTTTGSNTAIQGTNTGSGYGVHGLTSSGIAGYFVSSSNHAVLTSGLYYGGYFQTTSSSYAACIGYAQNNSNYGMLGYSNAWALYGAGSAYITGTYQGSDERLKENIQDLGNSLDKIASLRAVSFDWKPNTDASVCGIVSDVGLIAQETINVLPNIVKEVQAPQPLEGKNVTLNQELGTFYTIDYGKLIPYMVDAIQELKQQNDALAARIAALEAK